jgi:hypothetical protein
MSRIFDSVLKENYYLGQNLGTLNTQQINKVNVTEMDLWRRSTRKSGRKRF